MNGCICCNLVGQLGDALDTLREDVQPDRIIIETSGSAFPATLAMEINRLGRETGHYALDGVIVVIDVENWKGYEDTSVTAKMQAQYTDLIIFNKWEGVSERQYEDCLDRVGDLELQVATVKSDKGRVNQNLLLGLDSALARKMDSSHKASSTSSAGHGGHSHASDHQNEVEVLSITLNSTGSKEQGVDLESLETFLLSAPKDEIYRIKAIVTTTRPPTSSDGTPAAAAHNAAGDLQRYILNWAFGRWTFTLTKLSPDVAVLPTEDSLPMKKASGSHEPSLRMTIILAKYEAEKWKKRIEAGGLLKPEHPDENSLLEVRRLS